VEIIKGSEAEPQLSWLGFVVTGKARAAIRRAVRNKEREDVAELGSKLYDQIAARTPAKVGKKALREALKRLGMEEEEDLMYAIGAAQITDHEVMEALVPGITAGFEEDRDWIKRNKQAISIRGIKPGNAYTLAECCNPVPGDRIVGLRRKGESVEVHNINCLSLADGIDNDWIDLNWGSPTGSAIGRLSVILYDRRGTIAEMANIVARNNADVRSLEQVRVENPFATYEIDVEVQDLAHLTRVLSALRASDAVARADRI